MIFLEDLKITGKKVFIFGILSEYSNHIIKLLIKNEIAVDLWDPDINIIIKNKDKLEYKSKYITFTDPLNTNININDYEYFLISNGIDKNKEYYNFFNKKDIKNKIYTTFDIIYKIYPNIEFTGIIGNYGKNIINSVLKHVKKEFSLDINKNFLQEDFNETHKINIPIIIPFNIIKYIKYIKFSSIIIYDYNKIHFLDKDNIKMFNKHMLNNSEIEIIINIDNLNLKNWYDKLKDNSEYTGILIPISVLKILNNGISFVNNTIYDYYENNLNYDIMENEYIDNNFTKLIILITYIYNKKNNILDGKNLIQCLSTYKGEKNFFEHIATIENIHIISNISIDSNELLELPFKTYDNIYTLLLVNNKEHNEKFFNNNSRIVFYIDKYNFIKETSKNIFHDEQKAFEKIYSLCLLENKENKITILISTNSINNNISFDKEIENIKDTLNHI